MNEMISGLKFDDRGLIPAITQDCRTDEVLMLAYMKQESLKKTMETGKVHYFSRSRSKLWLKGETSGHFQQVRSISLDCDSDTLLIKVEQTGAACHTGHHSCFYRKLDAESLADVDAALSAGTAARKAGGSKEPGEGSGAGPADAGEPAGKPADTAAGLEVLREVYNVIADRTVNPKEGSYTNYLFQKGLDKILKKVGEEASEVIIAAKNGSGDELRGEVSDLFYHLCVLLVERGLTLEDICAELKDRR